MLTPSHHPRPPRGDRVGLPRRGERGFTLIEVVTAVAIILLISAPLASSMLLGFRVTDQTGANIQHSLNRDEASAVWASDVGSVDATGVSYTTGRACGSADGGTLYVTFNSTTLSSSAVTQVRRSSYYVVGAGRDMYFERRECQGPLASLSLTNYRSAIVADRIGEEGVSQANTVFAPAGPGQPACDEFFCGAVVNGRGTLDFELGASRRVFGAGTPLEVGRLYSSAFTRQGGTDERYRYVHFSSNGTPGTIEQRFAQRLSLAPGLDGPVGMKVEFKVAQRTTGKWLEKVGANYTFTANTETWVDGVYDAATETWSIPLTVGTEKRSDEFGPEAFTVGSITAGGEYGVYTRLTEISNSTPGTPKEYGGVNGFPMWFDWRPDQVVFVSTTGDDNSPTKGRVDANGVPRPLRTITKAFELARDADPVAAGLQDPRPEILVERGTYNGQVNLTTANAANNTTLQGALSVGTWLRSGPDFSASRRSFLNGSQVDSTQPTFGMSIDGAVTGLRIRQMEVASHSSTTTVSATAPAAYSTYGIRASNGASIELQSSDVYARAPFDVQPTAPPATDGGAWVVACSGTQGAVHSTATNSLRVPTVGGPAGSVSESNCDDAASQGRAGGNGGGGGSSGGSSGQPGSPGSTSPANGATPGAAGGANGSGGDGTRFGDCDPEDGTEGRGGRGGNGGSQAPSGFQPGAGPSASAAGWVPGRARSGNNGTAGGGGGGSGGGGGNGCAGFVGLEARGRQGATGGDGGRAGQGGGGGLGGGSAIALYLWTSGPVRLVNTGAGAAPGGNGQPGGQGGRGGNGGAGGAAQTSTDPGGESEGAGGGGGGGGGAGGNGGAGGHSISIFLGGGTTQSQVRGGNATATGVVDAALDTNYLEPNSGGRPGGGGPVALPLNGGVAGGGAGGPGGNPNSSCLICFQVPLVNWNISIGNYGAGAGEAGQGAVSAASVGRDGDPGSRCKIWSWTIGGTGGSCVLLP